MYVCVLLFAGIKEDCLSGSIIRIVVVGAEVMINLRSIKVVVFVYGATTTQ